MRLRAITEDLDRTVDEVMDEKEADETVRRTALENVSASSMIDSNQADKTWPFIYSGTLGLFVKQGGYHYDWLNTGPPDQRKVLANVYYGGELDAQRRRKGNSSLPGVAGRIGVDVTVDSHHFDSVMAFYNSSDPDSFKECLAELLHRNYINISTYVVSRYGTVRTAGEILGKEPSLRKTFDKPAAKKTWAGEMGKIVPGAKWWAPTSESRI